MAVPDDLEDRLDELSAEQLDDVARLAEEQRRQQRIDEKEESAVDSRGDPMPSDVPAKATLTKKTINDNEYWYWQWRDGDSIRSQYKGPAGNE